MVPTMKKILLTVALFFTLVSSLKADTINVLFGGTIDRLAITPEPPFTFSVDYGLGINAGDHFIGKFSYDSQAAPIPGGFSFERIYAVTSFDVKIQNVALAATESRLVLANDGFLVFVYVLGQLTNGLYMSVGLTRGREAPIDLSPPTYLSDADWYLGCFKISSNASIPIEDACPDFGAIVAVNIGGRNDFFLMTIPEPSAWLLFGFGLIGMARLPRRFTGSLRV
jgi:hypothetical protein